MDRFIELIKYLLLSIVQGVGEVLPISSSGHLIFVRNLVGVREENLNIEILLHLSSLLALFVYYKKEIFCLVGGCYKYILNKDENYKKDYIFVKGMIFSLIPTCVIGYFFNDYLDFFLKYPFFIGIFLVFNGINLYLIRKKEGRKNVCELSNSSFFKIGVGQCLGLVPGFSRSGSALSMCYREGVNREDGEKFTFLMLFPLVVGSLVLNIKDFSFPKERALLMAICFVVTFTITLLSIGLLNKILKNNKLHYFCYYCVIIGIVVMFMG